ncbi:two component transcriptional regulator, AraC family [Pelagirhabdus alkalitolerans]|uniref:Two component transcriptional regulator, AraC family n=1 Tax=Pelagirhabdus alkalitolerans TaxID=1612202 RepID=A0A1G6LE16_9BACI|nr:helix-turn-helix domain-containing protein [Pelagirhabdus alkalitolerans]SDC41479.1 two component transcriptional regulator, AraC family [Pelagirhabdus alkalitolerans]
MTMKILLVDDEKLERVTQRKFIEVNRPDLEICGEASNGDEAIKLIEEHKPDLICLDIQMPGTTGVDVVKKSKKIHPDGKIIMVTAYDTFEYARQVMKYGVKEYLLKPVKESEFLTSIDQVLFEHQKEQAKIIERQRQEERIDTYMSSLRANRILGLLMDYHVDGIQDESLDELMQMDVFAAVVSLREGGHDELARIRKAMEEELLHSHPKTITGPVLGTHIPVLLVLEKQSESMEKRVQHLVSRLNKRIGGLGVLMGAGRMIQQKSEFSRSYEEAISALSIVRQSEGARFHIHHQVDTETAHHDFAKESRLIEAVKQGEIQYIEEEFLRYITSVSEMNGFRFNAVKARIEEFFVVLHRALEELGVHSQRFSSDMISNLTQLREQTHQHIKSVTEDVNRWRADDMTHALDQLKSYIDHHYHEGITLEEAADQAGLSMYYVSKLFKERFGKSFIQYVTERRITEAKDLLSHTKQSLKEIALDLGYKDPNYFSRVFKKETGMSPSEYRESKMKSNQ